MQEQQNDASVTMSLSFSVSFQYVFFSFSTDCHIVGRIEGNKKLTILELFGKKMNVSNLKKHFFIFCISLT